MDNLYNTTLKRAKRRKTFFSIIVSSIFYTDNLTSKDTGSIFEVKAMFF